MEAAPHRLVIRLLVAGALVLLHPQSARSNGSPCTPPTQGLVAWYPADGSTADLAAANDATLENGASYGPGRSGQAFELDGDDDFVSAPATEATDPLFAGTLSAWVQLDERPSEAGHAMSVIGLGGDGTDFDLFVSSGNQFFFSVGAGIQAGSPRVAKTGTWYHLVGTWDSLAGIRFYVGGALDGTNLALVEREASGEPLWIGDQPFLGSRPFHGRIDDVRIYDRALDDDEIQQLECVFPGICGDANNDASVKSTDAAIILRYAVGQPVDCPSVRCDTNDDGSILASDALSTLRAAVGQDIVLACPAA